MSTVDPINDLEARMLAAAQAASEREKHRFPLPPKSKDREIQKLLADGMIAIHMVELTTEEELVAARRASGDPVVLAFELAKLSLCGVEWRNADPKKPPRVEKIGDGAGDAAAIWNRSAKLRNLITTGYGYVNSATKDDAEAFIKGCTVLAE